MILEEEVGRAGKAFGPVENFDFTAPPARSPRLGNIVPRRLHVASDEKILIPVAIGIEEARSEAPTESGDTRALGPIGERAVTVVAKELIGAEGGDVDVRIPVAVDVAHGSPLAEGARLDACGPGNVDGNCLPLWVDQGDGGVVGSTKD